MSQNTAVQTVKTPGGTYTFPNVDSLGNLMVVEAESPTSTTTPISSSSGNVAAASAVATLAAAAAKTTYISGLALTGGGATGASLVTATVAGLLGGTMSLTFAVPAGVTLGATPILLQFNPPLPASAVNTAIVVTLPSLGAGNTNAAAAAWGFQK